MAQTVATAEAAALAAQAEAAAEAAASAAQVVAAAEAAALAAQAVVAAAATQALWSFVNLYKLGLNPKKEGRGQVVGNGRDYSK